MHWQRKVVICPSLSQWKHRFVYVDAFRDVYMRAVVETERSSF